VVGDLEVMGTIEVPLLHVVSSSQVLLDCISIGTRGLSHQECCPLCDQDDESIDQLLVSSVFAKQCWFYVF
jgi:hypothetical protein